MKRSFQTTVHFARPQPLSDELGGVIEAYAPARVSAHASVFPAFGKLLMSASGEMLNDAQIMLLPPDCPILPRDGVWVRSVTAAPDYRCVRVDRYPLHVRATIERRSHA